MSEEKIKKSFCVLPWIHTFVNNSGDYQICCTGEVYKNELRDETGRKLNIRDGLSNEEVVNSDFSKSIRKEMLQGSLPQSCFACMKVEKSNGKSRRQIENEEYSQIIDSLVSNTNEDGSIQPNTKHVDYRLGNICNLKCRMCNPTASSKWENDFLELKEGLIDLAAWQEYVKDYKTLSLQDQDYVLKDFKEKEKHVERVHFGGGEPLLSKGMIDILEYCIEIGRASQMTISYNTNLTLLPEKVLECWSHFKEVKILASIDGIGKVNDYIRYPSKWSEVDKNLRFLEENYSKYNISEILVSTTVQVNNIFHLHEIFEYLSQFKFVTKSPSLVLLDYPSYLSPWILPDQLKKKALKLLRFIITVHSTNKNEQERFELVESIQTCINSLLSKPPEEHVKSMQYRFCEFSRRFDEKNKLNYSTVNPEYSELFDNYEK